MNGDANESRKGLISPSPRGPSTTPDRRSSTQVVFPPQTRRLREAVFTERRKQLALLARDMLVLLSDAGAGLTKNNGAPRQPR